MPDDPPRSPLGSLPLILVILLLTALVLVGGRN